MGRVLDIIISPLTLIDKKLGKAVESIGLIVAGAVTGNPGLIAAGLSMGASLLSPKPKAPSTSAANASRLDVSINLRAPRTIVFGRTAMNTDLRDQEWSADQSHLHRFLVVASHKVQAIEEIWFDDKQAWTSAGGVTAAFTGYLTVHAILEGSAANAINISARMGSSRRYTGCAYVHLDFKVTGNTSKTSSPFAQSIPTRVTVIGKGAALYDPRKDSTVGGSGPHRANDQTTWTWDDSACRNPALQQLWYELGWRIQNPVTSAWKLAVGKGIPPARINLASYIDAANICDESVAIAAGGTEPRYRSDGVFNEGDDPSTVRESLKATCNAVLDDVDGKIRITVLHNDLASPIGSLSTDDVLGAFTWTQTQPLDQTVNIIRGGYTDPSTTSLYQLADYPEVSYASPDGIDRPQTVDLALVQSPSQAQRLVKLRLQRAVFGGVFEAVFQSTAWRYQKGDVIQFTFAPLGWASKLLRIADMEVRVDGTVPMMLREENAALYPATATDAAPIVGVNPTTYDPTSSPVALAINDAGNTSQWSGIVDDNGHKPDDDANRSPVDRYLNRNSSFSDWTSTTTPTGWETVAYGLAGTLTQSTSGAVRGAYSAQVANGTARYGDAIPVAVGDTLWIEWYFQTSAAGSQPGGPTWYVGGEGMAANGTTALQAYYVGANNAQFATGAVQQGIAKITITSGVYFRPMLYMGNSAGAVGLVTYLSVSREQPGSTVGAKAGTDLTDSANAVLGDSAIKNTAIVYNVDGTLSGAGGGTAPNLASIAGSLDLGTGKIIGKSLANVDAPANTKLGGIAAGATVGARAGLNLVDSAGNSLGDSGIKNSSVSMNSDGSLANAGGGAIAYDSLPDGTTYKKFQVTERTKLTGVAPGATSDLVISSYLAEASIVGNTFTKTAATATFDTAAATDRVPSPCKMSCKTHYGVEMALSLSASFANSVDAQAYQIRTEYTGSAFNAYAYVNGVKDTTTLGAYDGNTLFEIGCDDVNVYLIFGGVIVRTYAVAAGQSWSSVFHIKSTGGDCNSIKFGSWTDRNFGNMGGATKPENNATVGSRLAVNAKDSAGAVLSDASVKNSSVSMNPDGTLNNAGGGGIAYDSLPDGAAYKKYLPAERTKLTGIETGATLGATWNANLAGRPANVAALAGGENIQNSGITYNVDGTLTGAGGGTAPSLSSIAGSLDLSTAKITGKSLANVDAPASTKLGTIQTNADVTANSQVTATMLTNISVPADYQGTVDAAQFNILVVPSVLKGGVKINGQSNVSYAIVANGCTAAVDTTNGSDTKSQVSISALGSNQSTVDLTITVDGTALPPLRTTITKALGDPPAAAGGTGAKSGSVSTFTNSTGTSYAAITAVMTVTLATGERLVLTAPLDYRVIGVNASSATVTAKGQYSPKGANTWTDMGTAITGSAAQSQTRTGAGFDSDFQPGTLGHGDFNMAKTGLAAGDYDVRIVALLSAAKTVSYVGSTATVEAKA